MSFKSIIKSIDGTLLGIEHVAAPIAEGLFPQFAAPIAALDNIFSRVPSTIITLESSVSDGQGQLKAQAVIADFETGLDFTNSILAMRSKMLDYDHVELQNAINSLVAGYNSLAKVKASFKKIDIPVKPVGA